MMPKKIAGASILVLIFGLMFWSVAISLGVVAALAISGTTILLVAVLGVLNVWLRSWN